MLPRADNIVPVSRDGANAAERVRFAGASGATLLDLMAVSFTRREEDILLGEAEARRLLQRFGGLDQMQGLTSAEIASTGLEGFEVLRAQALIELGRRMATREKHSDVPVSTAREVYDRLREMLRGEKQEHFMVVMLDAKNAIQRIARVHVGTLTMSVVGAREVFREAIRDGASSIIVAHNHPSGDPTPSPEDIEVTKKLSEIGQLLDIPVVDHIIIGDRRYVSLNEEGLL
jgi:DNA repair protein RadC